MKTFFLKVTKKQSGRVPKWNAFNTLWLCFFATLPLCHFATSANAIPTVNSVQILTDPVERGKPLTISVNASNDTSRGVIVIDFRPSIPRVIRMDLVFDGANWVGTEVVPSDVPLNGEDTNLPVSFEAEIILEDVQGNRGEMDQMVDVMPDDEPPTIIVTSPQNNALVGDETSTITGNVGRDATALTIGGSSVPITFRDGSFTFNAPLIEGANQVELRALDICGNETTMMLELTRDTLPPELSVTVEEEPADSTVQVNTLMLNIGGTAVDPNLKEVMVNGTPATLTGDSFSIDQPLGLEGSNRIEVVAFDQLLRRTTFVFNAVRDTAGPSVSITTPLPNATLNQNTVTVTGTTDLTAVNVKVNGTTANLSSGTFQVQLPLQQGSNTLIASAADALGNVSTVQRIIFVDSIAPSIELITPQDGVATADPSIAVTGNTDDSSASVTINGQTTTVSTSGNFSTSVSLVEGQNLIIAQATDATGNQSSVQRTVTRDSIAPRITITSPTSPFNTSSDSVAVNGTVNDDSALLTLNGQPIDNTSGTFSETVSLPNSTAPFAITVIATDAVGNADSDSITVNRDTEAPQVAFLNPSDGAVFTASSISILGSVSDPTATVMVNGQLATVNNDRFSLTNFILSEGSNTLTVEASDALGNAATPDSVTVTLDSTPPAVPVLTTPPSLIGFDRVTLQGSAEASATLSIEGGLLPVTTTVDTDGLFLVEVLLQANASNTLTLRATDSAGNRSQPLVHTIVSDTIKPQITINTPTDGQLLEVSNVSVTGIVNEENLPTFIDINGDNVSLNPDGTFGHTLTLSDGLEQSITVTVIDQASNTNSESVSVDVDTSGGDDDPPVIVIVSPLFDSLVPGSTFEARALISDESPIDTIELNGSQIVLTSGTFTDFTFNATVDSNGEFTLTAIDNKTQSSSITHRVVVDDEAPDAPTVSLVSPASPTNNTAVTLYGAGEANQLLVVSGGLVPVDTTINGAGQFTVQVSLLENQDNDLELRVIDGVNQQSAPTPVTVTQDLVPPEVTSVSPANNANQVATSTTVEVNFDEALSPFTADGATLSINGSTVATTNTLSNSDQTLVLTPDATLPESTEVLVSVPTSVADVAGNELLLPFTSTFTTTDSDAPDSPFVDAVSARTQELQLLLTGSAEPLSEVSVSGGASVVSQTAGGGGSFAIEVTLNPNSVNTLNVTATDAANNVSASTVVEVAHDNIAPQLNASQPADMATDVSLTDPIVLTFSEALSAGSLDGIALKAFNVVPADIQLSSANVVTITPDAALEEDLQYSIVIPASVADLAGNELGETLTRRFTTLDQSGPPTPVIQATFPGSPTNSTSLTVSAFATPGSTVTLQGGANPINLVVDSTGEFTVDVPLQLDVVNNITLIATDANDNSSEPTAPVVIRQDATAPTVTSTQPAEGGSIPVTSTLFIEFSETMAVAPFNAAFPAVRVLDSSNQPVPGELRLSGTGQSVTFVPVRNFEPEADYGLIIGPEAVDLAGNALDNTVTVNFSTQASSIVERPDAPVVDPLPPESSNENNITLSGSAEAGSLLTVLGGNQPVTTTVPGNGQFSINVPLVEDELNELALFITVDSVNSLTTLVSIVHATRPAGIRIITPVANTEYSNVSVTVLGIIDDAENVSDIQVNGEPAGILGEYFAKQVVFSGDGPQTITATAQLAGGSMVTDTVNIIIATDPEGTDTKAPVVKIVYPEEGDTFTNDFIEIMATVEEGTMLSIVESDGVIAHNMLGNILFIYHQLKRQGINDVQVTATDDAGLVGYDSVRVFLDNIGVSTPVLDETPSLTDKRIIDITGTADPASIIVVTGAQVPVRVLANALGEFTIPVPLNANTENRLNIQARDNAGNTSDVVSIAIMHDDTAPTVIATNPNNGDVGIPENAQIIIDFSEALNEDSLEGEISVTNGDDETIEGNALLSADGTRITFIPAFKFQRGDTITVNLGANIADENGFTLEAPVEFSFATALRVTTLSGVVIGPDLQPLMGVTVGIEGTDIVQETSTFGTFLLDEVPLGEQILVVDGRPDLETGLSPTGDNRIFGLLTFAVNVIENTDNSLGRPIFLVPTDFSTLTGLSNTGQTIAFNSILSDLDGFSLTYENGAARFADGTSRGSITATRIEPAFIPDRLPGGAIPHFMVRLDPEDLSFEPAASLTFPNAYDLDEGEEVIVFYFQNGVHEYQELGRATVDSNDLIETDAILTESGFVGIIPADPTFDLTRTYLNGRVVDSQGNGIANIPVNAIAGNTIVLTNEEGEYSIPMPDVRIFLIETFATVPTSIGESDEGSPSLVFTSGLTDLNPSGITEMPDIVVNSFILGGSIRYIGDDGVKIPRTGLSYSDGALVAVDDGTANNVDIFVYRQINMPDGTVEFDTMPYARTKANLDALKLGFDAGFSIPFIGSLTASVDATANANIPMPGDVLKIVAFDPRTGFYGETNLKIPSVADSSNLDVITMIDLRPPHLEVDMNRVFFIEGVRRRANIPNNGIVLTDDEYVEIKTLWKTSEHTPLDRSEIRLSGLLRVDSIDFEQDYFFTVNGGEHFEILEIREAIFPARLEVLQQETDVGRETFMISRDGSFSDETLIPLHVRTDSFGLTTMTTSMTTASQASFRVIDLDITEDEDGEFSIEGRTAPGETIDVGGQTFTADLDGFFNGVLDDVPDGGVALQVGDSETTLVGASFTPEITLLNPNNGSQGDIITVVGEFFSPTPAENNVFFNGTAATVLQASENELRVVVPEGASSGDVTVTVAGRISNGVPFDFVSRGVNNGSFEDGSFRGYNIAGEASVVEGIGSVIPTDRSFMAFLNNLGSPRDGNATLITDRFIVPDGMDFLVFDFNFMGTALFSPFTDYVDFFLIENGVETQIEDVIADNIPQLIYTIIAGYNQGSGFQTGLIDVSAYAGTETAIQFKVVLRGRGVVPTDIPGVRIDDDNPLDLTKLRGTSLLLDNLRLTGTDALPDALTSEDINVSAPSGNQFTITAPPGTAPPGGRVFSWGIQSGDMFDVDVDPDGSFSLTLPLANGVSKTFYALNYATPKTTGDNTSDRLFSPSLELVIPSTLP